MEEPVKPLSDEGNNCSEEMNPDPEESAGMDCQRATTLAQEALLVEDGSVDAPPAHVARLLASIRAEAEAGADAGADADADMDALAGLMLVLCVETGFTPLQSEDAFDADVPGVPGLSAANLRRVSRMPRGWRRPEGDAGPRYALDLALGGAERAARLVGVACADVLIANMVAVEPPDVAFSQGFAPAACLRDPAALALRFKNTVSLPVRAAILNERRLCNASLPGLPVELQLQLGQLLPLPDMYHLALSCRALSHLLTDPSLWRVLVRRRFTAHFKELSAREDADGADPVDWRLEYRKKLRLELDARRRPLSRGPSGPSGAPSRPSFAYAHLMPQLTLASRMRM